tara:strand:- start:3781 stop:4092 length:312 start_codon:yes stop_codon:yes gene_type:complete
MSFGGRGENKITKDAVNAFLNGKNFKRSNTQVVVHGDDALLSLFGNTIARKVGDKLYITHCGWETMTTRERLNGLPNVSIYQKNFQWYLNDKAWDGKLIEVKQ